MNIKVLAATFVLSFAALACSLGAVGGDEPIPVDELQASFDRLPDGDAARGEQIFVDQACRTCHMDLAVGPRFPGDPPLAVLAGTRKSDYSAELYLYESIAAPRAYVVSGFQKEIMPAEYGKTLTEQELADLIAYLMTMR